MILVKFTLYAAFEAVDVEPATEFMAESLRQSGALAVASEYDEAEVETADDEETDGLLDALEAQFPEGLPLGPVPGVKVLGHNGTHKHARLERKSNPERIELWLGTEKERYPLVSFPVKE
jgi:hypothetical protein